MLLTNTEIQNKIHVIRDVQVILDRDLAELYEVETGALKRAVKRNAQRFPQDFMFELTRAERESLICQTGTSKMGVSGTRGGNRSAPFAFTEPGVAMLSSVLRSEKSDSGNVSIMRTFIQLRTIQSPQVDSKSSLKSLEGRLDEMNSRIAQLESGPTVVASDSFRRGRNDQDDLSKAFASLKGSEIN